VYAFVNWPTDIKAEDPAKAWPLAIHDSTHGYVLARNGFDKENAVLFTGLCRIGPVGYHKVRAQQDVWVWGMGYRVGLDRFGRAGIQDFQTAKDGSTTFKNGETAFAADFSKAAGCDAVIIRYPSKGLSVMPPKAPGEGAVADADINLQGRWNNGLRFEQNGKNLIAYNRKPGKPEKQLGFGTLEGRKITRACEKKKGVSEGDVTADANKIEWANNTEWTRGKKSKKWKHQDGDKLKTFSQSIGGASATIITFAADGKHPSVSVEGDTLVIGGQKASLKNGAFVLETFNK